MPLTKIQSLGITDGTIVNADINASAAIAGTKLSGAGKVLQVVTATDQTSRNTSSTSFVTASNTLSVAITPSSASNKVFIIAQFSSGQGASAETIYTIFRGATNIGNSNNGFARLSTGTGGMATIAYLDSPSTTSSTTYQVQLRLNGTDTNTLNWNSCLGSITVMEIAA